MSVRINIRYVGNVVIVDIAGRLTWGEGTSTLQSTILDLLAKNHKNILLNMAEVSCIDSQGVGVLVSGHDDARNQGGYLKLLNLTPRVEHWLQMIKLYVVFEVLEDEAQAVRSFPPALSPINM